MLNCKQVTKLVSESFVRQLLIGERLSLWVHTARCRTCRSFRRLQIQLSHVLRENSVDDDTGSESQLSHTARERTVALIESRLKND
jgi:hypothetical protein